MKYIRFPKIEDEVFSDWYSSLKKKKKDSQLCNFGTAGKKGRSFKLPEFFLKKYVTYKGLGIRMMSDFRQQH